MKMSEMIVVSEMIG